MPRTKKAKLLPRQDKHYERLNVTASTKNYAHSDGWSNTLTGLGNRFVDKRLSTVFAQDSALVEEDLNAMYENDPLAHRVIEILTTDLFRKQFEVEGDTDGLAKRYMKKIHAYPKLLEGTKWGLLHGGSVALMIIDDDGMWSEPVNEDNINSIKGLTVYDRWRTIFTTADLYLDPANPKFNTPEYYNVFPIGPISMGNYKKYVGEQQRKAPPSAWGFVGNEQYQNQNAFVVKEGLMGNMSPGVGAFRVHESRLLRFDAPITPLRDRIRNRYWNLSALQSGYNSLRAIGEGYANIELILKEFVLGSMSIDNLMAMMANKENGEENVRKRLAAFNLSKHTLNTILLDTKETYTRNSVNVSGLKDLLEEERLLISAAFQIPCSVLFGDSPSGLNSSGSSEIRRYYDYIDSLKETMHREPYEKFVKYMMLAKDGPFKGKELPEWDITFPPLWTLTELEESQMRKNIADADEIYYQMGLPAQSILASRFGGSNFTLETKLPEDNAIETELSKFLPPAAEVVGPETTEPVKPNVVKANPEEPPVEEQYLGNTLKGQTLVK